MKYDDILKAVELNQQLKKEIEKEKERLRYQIRKYKALYQQEKQKTDKIKRIVVDYNYEDVSRYNAVFQMKKITELFFDAQKRSDFYKIKKQLENN